MKNKKKKNIKSLIYQLFKKRVNLPNNGEHLRVKIVDDEANTISGSLGIAEKRKDFLIDLVHAEMKETDNIVHIIVSISSHITHQNELVFATYVLAQHIEREAHSPVGRILGIIGRKFNGED